MIKKAILNYILKIGLLAMGILLSAQNPIIQTKFTADTV
ncbi:hypothetical protein PMI13_03491 [Chryseobacterium populi]|uniref:Uncharacterized protein n=1 Tax=Chryseobacterium populi TaxID=1144316 RepID=J3CCQ9_9FLAO|nr:hypothetical protein PMI13_03491 [Chryseobacterium populi]